MLILRLIPMVLILSAAGIAVGVEAQSGDGIEEGSAPYAVAQALTEEEAAAGMPVQVKYFESFEEAMSSIHADPEDFSADSVAPASAAAETSRDGAAEASPERAPEKHCVVRIEPLRSGEEASAMSAATCFDRFSDAIYAATGGAVRLAPTVSPADVTEETVQPESSHQTVLSIDYRDSNFSGSTLTWVANNTVGCTTGLSYAAPSMPSGWNDVVSSARTFAGCTYNRHYEHTNYGGSKIDCYCASMGAMNDKTSSEKWNRVQPTP